MRILVQRVKEAKVEVNGVVQGQIDKGLLLFVGFCDGDDKEKIDYMIKKVLNLRIFNDTNDVMNLSVKDVLGSILSISQFTLYAETTSGNRPSYSKAMDSKKAALLYNYFNNKLKEYIKVETGVFGAHMEVSLLNDGPVTIMLER